MSCEREPLAAGARRNTDQNAQRLTTTATDKGASVSAKRLDLPPDLPALTGIRALGLAAVITYHLQGPLLALLPAVEVANPLLQFFFLGLDVFFILSGFIISYNYADRLSTLSRRECYSFLAARVARIYPVFLATLLFTATLIGVFAARGRSFDPSIRHTALGFIGNLFMLQSLPGISAWNTPSWSVSTEFAAYLVFPLAAGFLVRQRRRAALILSIAILGLLIVYVRGLALFPEFPVLLFYWGRLICEFSIGCLLWVVWRNGCRPQRRWDLVAITSLLVSAIIIVVAGSSAKSWLAVGFLAVFVLAVANSTSFVRVFLASRLVEAVGRASYSIYLIHYPILYILYTILPHSAYVTAPLGARIALIVAYFATPVLFGAVVYRFFEEPARRWVRRRAVRFAPDQRFPSATA